MELRDVHDRLKARESERGPAISLCPEQRDHLAERPHTGIRGVRSEQLSTHHIAESLTVRAADHEEVERLRGVEGNVLPLSLDALTSEPRAARHASMLFRCSDVQMMIAASPVRSPSRTYSHTRSMSDEGRS